MEAARDRTVPTVLRPGGRLTTFCTDCTHHKPGLPLAVSQKKWLNRSLVLKLLSMVAECRMNPE